MVEKSLFVVQYMVIGDRANWNGIDKIVVVPNFFLFSKKVKSDSDKLLKKRHHYQIKIRNKTLEINEGRLDPTGIRKHGRECTVRPRPLQQLHFESMINN